MSAGDPPLAPTRRLFARSGLPWNRGRSNAGPRRSLWFLTERHFELLSAAVQVAAADVRERS